MSTVQVYTTTRCPYCVAAKNLLSSLNVPFEEFNLTGKFDELDALKKRTGLRTVPQIFINEQLIGGFDELSQLNASGELQKLLTSG